MKITNPVNQANGITRVITIWVICLHTIIHLLGIFFCVSGYIIIGSTKVKLEDLQGWHLSEFFILIAVLSLILVLITALNSGQAHRNCLVWVETGLQIALSFGTFIYTMVFNHIYQLMSWEIPLRMPYQIN